MDLISPEEVKSNKLEKLEFLETLLLFRGWFSRGDLKDEFDTAPAVATRIISKYRLLLKKPSSVYLDGSTKLYNLDFENFTPIFSRTSDRALSYLRLISKKQKLGAFENISIEAPSRLVNINLDVITALSRAIFNNKKSIIEYFSSRNGLDYREFYPHALFDGGVQWYVRGYFHDPNDSNRSGFTDLALSRVKSIEILDEGIPQNAKNSEDKQWNKFIRLELTAHPKLSNPESIEFQYDMVDGIKELHMRAAMAGYFLSHCNVDCSIERTQNPKRYQLWLRNNQSLYDVESADFAPGYIDGNT
jgi:hypothetical protein